VKFKTRTVYIYYDYPIIFSAVNEEGNLFIFLFANEENSNLRYLCREISSSMHADLENNQKDIRSIFESPGKLYSLYLNAYSEEPIEVVETTENITPFLPEKDFFIGVHESKTSQIIKLYYDGLLEGEMRGIKKTARNALAKGIAIE
jgi:hypothetical protein